MFEAGFGNAYMNKFLLNQKKKTNNKIIIIIMMIEKPLHNRRSYTIHYLPQKENSTY